MNPFRWLWVTVLQLRLTIAKVDLFNLKYWELPVTPARDIDAMKELIKQQEKKISRFRSMIKRLTVQDSIKSESVFSEVPEN